LPNPKPALAAAMSRFRPITSGYISLAVVLSCLTPFRPYSLSATASAIATRSETLKSFRISFSAGHCILYRFRYNQAHEQLSAHLSI
jgi:hypothetical protein